MISLLCALLLLFFISVQVFDELERLRGDNVSEFPFRLLIVPITTTVLLILNADAMRQFLLNETCWKVRLVSLESTECRLQRPCISLCLISTLTFLLCPFVALMNVLITSILIYALGILS